LSLNDLKISHKLTAAFTTVVLIIAVLGVTIFLQLGSIKRATAEVNHGEDVLNLLATLKRSVDQQEAHAFSYIIFQQQRNLDRRDHHIASFAENLAKLKEMTQDDPGAAALIGPVQSTAEDYRKNFVEPAFALAPNPAAHGQAVALISEGVSQRWMDPFDVAADAIQTRQEARLTELAAQQQSASGTALWALYIGIGLAVLLAVLSGLMLTRAIAAPVVAMTAAMRRLAGGDNTVEVPAVGRKDELGQMAAAVLTFKDAAIEKIRLEGEAAEQRRQAEEERARNEATRAAEAAEQASVVAALAQGLDHLTRGDLTYSLTEDFPGEYAKLKTDFNRAIEQLEEAMSVVVGNVSAIRSGAGEISQAADDLSRRTEQQAASLEETAAALDEITATVNRTASGARQASDTVQAAKGDAETSGNVVRDAVGAMGAIEKSAQEISQIIGVIDEIAFQTNLLALNAGVEAARAGDAGRGFAVVASEVRALAQRSAEAAKEIKVLISASTSQVNTGVSLVGQTGEALQRIVSRVAEIDSLVSEIAASAQEQATGLQQVNTAVNQMDQVTQQNAAMVEQSTAASHSLSQEAESLAGSVARFQIGAVAAPQARPAHRPVHRTVTAMKTVGRGGAARKLQPVAAEDGWEEF
jgi:methyl-accepting chemotaxis protein